MASDTIFIAGRYNKYSRIISQTPWFIEGNKQVAESVEGIISASFDRHLPHKRSKFIASGREDVDVQMLGCGRPFALEITGSTNIAPSEKLLREIGAEIASSSGGKVLVNDLQLVTKKDVAVNLKDEEIEKRKKYRAVCCCSRDISEEEMNVINEKFVETVLQQKTPIRVLHRRPLVTRSRTVFELQLLPHPDQELIRKIFDLILVVEAGTYIKEFVHSDFGRTSPSLCDIIGNCATDILSLDVEEVFVEWPAYLSPNKTK